MNTPDLNRTTGIEDFNWNISNKRKINRRIDTVDDAKVFCQEDYAQSLYDLMASSLKEVSGSKDLKTGLVYTCTITTVNGEYAIAQTLEGQSIYIDLVKERKDAAKLNLGNIDFTVGAETQAIVRNVMGTYYGSIVDCFIENTKVEFFEQITKQSLAYEARIESINNGGYIVEVQGIKCFLPGSLAAANKITDFESYLGKTIYVMIDGYVKKKDIFVVSYKKYLTKIMDQKIQELDLTKKYKGHVTGTSDFGVFVEWEDVYTGLIHKTEFDNQKVAGFTAGDEIEFYIKEVKEDNRLTLTFGQPVDKTLKVYEIKNSIDQGENPTFFAKVKHKRKNGALIELEGAGLMALIPQGRMSKDHKNLKSGDSITVIVYEVDPVMGKIFAEPVNE
jgi:small subunit ribosomal protein S1